MITGISKLEKDLRKPKMWSELLMPIAELIRPQPHPSCYRTDPPTLSILNCLVPAEEVVAVNAPFSVFRRVWRCDILFKQGSCLSYTSWCATY